MDDGYEDADDGPEAALFRRDVTVEQREAARLDRLLDAVLRDCDPVAESRRAAAKLWAEVCDLLRRAT